MTPSQRGVFWDVSAALRRNNVTTIATLSSQTATIQVVTVSIKHKPGESGGAAAALVDEKLCELLLEATDGK